MDDDNFYRYCAELCSQWIKCALPRITQFQNDSQNSEIPFLLHYTERRGSQVVAAW